MCSFCLPCHTIWNNCKIREAKLWPALLEVYLLIYWVPFLEITQRNLSLWDFFLCCCCLVFILSPESSCCPRYCHKPCWELPFLGINLLQDKEVKQLGAALIGYFWFIHWKKTSLLNLFCFYCFPFFSMNFWCLCLHCSHGFSGVFSVCSFVLQ